MPSTSPSKESTSIRQPDAGGQLGAQLKAMGYDKLNLGFYGSGFPGRSEVGPVVNEITVAGTDLGTITLAGTFGGLTTDVIKQLPPARRRTPSARSLKQASVYYGDASLAGRIIAEQAKQMGQEPAASLARSPAPCPWSCLRSAISLSRTSWLRD